jgi:type IV pilus assembly protein PilA
MNLKNKKAFTLLELLVVIAIIGVLAAIVMASLNSARTKANESALIQQLKEMSKLMEIEKLDSGNYSKLIPWQWLGLVSGSSVMSCDDAYGSSNTSNHKTNALSICKKIASIVNNNTAGYFGIVVWDSTKQDGNHYSIQAFLNGKYFCIGSGGQSFPATNVPNSVGCFSNP